MGVGGKTCVCGILWIGVTPTTINFYILKTGIWNIVKMLLKRILRYLSLEIVKNEYRDSLNKFK